MATPKKKRQDAFISAFQIKGTIKSACAAIGIDRATFYRWKKEKAFKARFDETDLNVTDSLEESAMYFAQKGNATLLIFLLKSRNPKRFNDRYIFEHQGQFTIKDFVERLGRPGKPPAVPGPGPGGSGVVPPGDPRAGPMGEGSGNSS